MDFERLKKVQNKGNYKILGVKPGNFLEIHEIIGEGDNKRIWKFKGLVIKVKRPNSHEGTFTIRGKASGISVEKIYPLSFDKFQKVILLDDYKIRRAKLYYIREKIGKDAKFKSVLDSKDKGKDLFEDISSQEEVVSGESEDKKPTNDLEDSNKEDVPAEQETKAGPEVVEEKIENVEQQDVEIPNDTKQESNEVISNTEESAVEENTEADVEKTEDK